MWRPRTDDATNDSADSIADGSAHRFTNAAALSTYGECDVTFTGNRIRDNAGNDYVRGGYFERAMKDL